MARTKLLKGNINPNSTPQSEAIPGRESDMVENSAGGFSFAVDSFGQLRRFLILGTEGGSYYAGQSKLTKQNAKNVVKAVQTDGLRAVKEIVEISKAGRAPKNDQALYALAVAAGMGNEATRKAALNALPEVARTGTHLFMFLEYVKEFRGFGPALRKAVARWYDDKDNDKLAYQLVKYRQREGWTHRDVLRIAHPQHRDLYRWVAGKDAEGELPKVIQGYKLAQEATDVKTVVKLINDYKLPREALPTEFLNEKEVWAALLEDMPMTALIRNLGNMSKVGLLTPLSKASKMVVDQLSDVERLRKARVHPLNVLSAKLTYGSGHSVRGSGEWKVVAPVVDALEDAFYAAFGNIEPSGKNTMLGIDVSGSMGGGYYGDYPGVGGVPGLSPAMAAAVMAMVTVRSEPNYFIGGFNTSFVDLKITAKDTLESAMRKTDARNFGGTDCAVAMKYATTNKIPIENFAIYTDAETWAGETHGSQALQKYRKVMDIPARMVNVAFVSNGFTIADPQDAGMMDVVGFDSAAPQLIADFAKGLV